MVLYTLWISISTSFYKLPNFSRINCQYSTRCDHITIKNALQSIQDTYTKIFDLKLNYGLGEAIIVKHREKLEK